MSYEDIKLKTYIDIAESGDLSKVQLSGLHDQEGCLAAWDKIVVENANHSSGRSKYNEHFILLQGYDLLNTKHLVVRSLLVIQLLEGSYENLDKLKAKGFKIDTSSPAAYEKSMADAFAKCGDIITRAKVRLSEIENLSKTDRKKKQEKKTSFAKIKVELSVALAPTIISDDLLLCEFNEYQEILRERKREFDKAKRRK